MSAQPTNHDPGPSAAITLGDDPLAALEAASWAMSALVGTMRDALTAPITEVLSAAPQRTAVLAALGLIQHDHDDLTLHASLMHGAADAARSTVGAKLSSLRQAASAATRDGGHPTGNGWAEQPDDVLLNQGRASAATGTAIATRIVPHLTGLAERLNGTDGRVLDIGTGVGAIAVVLARAFPRVHVLGIDTLPRVLALAETEMERATDVSDRVMLRERDVAQLSEHAAYDLIWLPAPFLSETVLDAGLPRIVGALRPGGWIVAGTNPASHDPLLLAVGRWTAVLNGGNDYDADRMTATLTTSGLLDIQQFPTVPGGQVLVTARRSAS